MIEQSHDRSPQRSRHGQADPTDAAQDTQDGENNNQKQTTQETLHAVIPDSIHLTSQAFAHEARVRLRFEFRPRFGYVTPKWSQTRTQRGCVRRPAGAQGAIDLIR